MADEQGLQQGETLAGGMLQQQHNQQHPDEEEEEQAGSLNVRPNVGIKRRYSELMCESDEDDFAGFDEDAASSENANFRMILERWVISQEGLPLTLSQRTVQMIASQMTTHHRLLLEEVIRATAPRQHKMEAVVIRPTSCQMFLQDTLV
uniref:Uncharacterized protein n=1 Tax=Anopheles merus TaxID=30066 RepID=A0A182UMY2_ANOME